MDLNKRLSPPTLALLAAASLLLSALPTQAQFLTNADFETEPLGTDAATTTFPGWTEGAGAAAVAATTPISGNHSAKLLYANAGNLLQNLLDTNSVLSDWVFETDFACSAVSGTSRSFNLNLRHSPTGFNQINLRIVDADNSGSGDVQIYNGSAWVSVLNNAVSFSSSATSLSVNHLKLSGHYTNATPSYDVVVVNASAVTNSATGLAYFQGTVPTAGTTLKVVSFETGNYPTTGGTFAVVDNVTVASGGTVSLAPSATVQPASQSVYETLTATFTATVGGTPPLSYQWRLDGTNLPGATATSLVLSNLTLSLAGNYSLVVSNALGTSTSPDATLTVLPLVSTTQMNNLWNLLPGDRFYLSNSGTNAERGLAYNPLSGNLLLASRAFSNNIIVLDAATGAEKYRLDMTGVAGGSIDLGMLGVADDGAVYAANLTTAAATTPYKIYRWSSDSPTATPTVVFQGDPADSLIPNLRWGDTLVLRGAGANTQILLTPGSTSAAVLLRTSSGLDFQNEIAPTVIWVPGAPGGFAQLGLAFGPGPNTFWGKTAGGLLRLTQFDPDTGDGSVVYADDGEAVPGTVTAIGVDSHQKWLAGLSIETPDNVRLYDISDTNAGPVLSDQELFMVDNPNLTVGGTGSITFGGNYVFALDSNNGIKAFRLNSGTGLPPFSIVAISQNGGTVLVTCPSLSGHSYQLQAKTSLSDSAWSNVGAPLPGNGSTITLTDSASGRTRFYRVQAQ